MLLHFRSAAFPFGRCLNGTVVYFQFPLLLHAQSTSWIWLKTKRSLIHSESQFINCIFFIFFLSCSTWGAWSQTEFICQQKAPDCYRRRKEDKRKENEMGFSLSSACCGNCWALAVNWSSTTRVGRQQQVQLGMFYSPMAQKGRPRWEPFIVWWPDANQMGVKFIPAHCEWPKNSWSVQYGQWLAMTDSGSGLSHLCWLPPSTNFLA